MTMMYADPAKWDIDQPTVLQVSEAKRGPLPTGMTFPLTVTTMRKELQCLELMIISTGEPGEAQPDRIILDARPDTTIVKMTANQGRCGKM